MSTTVQRAILCLIICATTASVPMLLAAEPPAPPPAPVPNQILGAQKVFISNGGEDGWLDYDPKHDPNLTYNEFWLDMKSWGKYELVSSPADADVVFEIHLLLLDRSPQLRLLILDPKSHITLWTLNQIPSVASRDATARKNFDKALNALVTTLQGLVAKGK
ncbi:MAG: hypothetical protein WB817_01730 [Terriglobales bacterium]